MSTRDQFLIGVNGWLDAERRETLAADRTKYLQASHLQSDDEHKRHYEKMREGLKLDLSSNQWLGKMVSHGGRFNPDIPSPITMLNEASKHPRAVGQLLHASLKVISGMNRNIALFRSRDVDEFPVIHEELTALTNETLGTKVVGEEVTLEHLTETAKSKIHEQMMPLADFIISRARLDEDYGEQTSPSTNAFLKLRGDTLNFAVDVVNFGIQTFGSIEETPCLEPLSITDAQLVYPFTSEFWDNYVLSEPQ